MRALAWISAYMTSVELKKDEKGAAFTEYVVLLAVIVALFTGILTALNQGLTTKVGSIVASIGG